MYSAFITRMACICMFLSAASLFSETMQPSSHSKTYFVDCSSSVQQRNGLSAATPWNNLEQINKHVFSAGDVVRFKRGSTCRGVLWPKGSGSESAAIRLTAYGSGVRPKIISGSSSAEAMKLFNQQYWDIDSLDISGGSTFGVFISGDRGILHHIHLKNLLVHDVGGAVMKDKESGLIVISPGSVDQHFDDVLVDGVTAYNTQQWVGIMVGGGNFGFPPESTWSTHVTIRNSVVHDVQGDGIVLFRVRDGRIGSSVAWNTGMQITESMGTPNAIWTWMCHDCVVEQNEAFLTDSPGVDGGAFDIDYGNTNNSVIDNYAHDTQGYCVAVFGAGFVTHQSLVRGNTCLNNARSPRMAKYQGAIFVHTWNGGALDGVIVEDNTIYWNPPGTAPAVLNDAVFQGQQGIFKNNHIYSTSPWIVASNRSLSFDENQYVLYLRKPDSNSEWSYDGSTFTKFSDYQRHTAQDMNSRLLQDNAVATGSTFWEKEDNKSPILKKYRDFSPPHFLEDISGNPVRLQNSDGKWTMYAFLPAHLDGDGSLNEECRRQLVILKSLATQFHGNGLNPVIILEFNSHSKLNKQDLLNAVTDLGINSDMTVAVKRTASDTAESSLILLQSPEGKVVRTWKEFAGASKLGVAIRERVGFPIYSQME